MPLRTIVVVVLRIYTIIMVVQALVQFVMVLPIYAKIGTEVLDWAFLAPIAMFALGVILWCATLPLARLVTKGHDMTVDVVSLKREDLYNFAFVFLGTYIVLTYIPTAAQNGYRFFLNDFSLPPETPGKGQFLVPFVADLLAIGFGLASALAAPKWSRILLKREQSDDQSRNLPD